jgi:hypothetical protein
MVTLSSRMNAQIDAVVEAATNARQLVRVYFEAENIRQANVTDNVALEDIVDAIIARCALVPGYELDPSEALNALFGDPDFGVRSIQ